MLEKFLNFFQTKKWQNFLISFWRFLFYLAVIDFLLVWFVDWLPIVVFSLLAFCFFVFYHFPYFGFLFVVFFFPFLNWKVSFGSLDFPIVDGLATVLFISWFSKRLKSLLDKQIKFKNFLKKDLPLMGFYLLWLFSGFLTFILNGYNLELFKYLLRPIAFFIPAFVWLPFNIIKNKAQLKRVLWVMVLAVFLVGFSGFFSIVFGNDSGLERVRAKPFSFAGFNPISGNQNAIAEAMIVGIPVVLLLFALSEKIKTRTYLFLFFIFFSIILFLTFSRAGYLAFLTQLAVLFFFRQINKDRLKFFLKIFLLIVVVLSVFYFSFLFDLSFVSSSNANRLLLSGISWHNFWQQPIWGNGLNSFQRLVGATFIYQVEFGDPLDSHGFIQKVMTEMGILGLISFLGLLFFSFKFYWQSWKKSTSEKEQSLSLVVVSLFLGVVVFQLFSTSYYTSLLWLPIGIGLVMSEKMFFLKENKK